MKQHYALLFLALPFALVAQNSTMAPLGDDNHRILERMEIKTSNFHGMHNALRPASRRDLDALRRVADTLPAFNNKIDQADLRYWRNDNNEYDTVAHVRKPFLKYFYRTPAHLFELKGIKNFYFNINPILHVKAGMELYNGETNFIFLNRRGAAIRGNIANRVYFYTDIVESQGSFPSYVRERILNESALPGAGYYKTYNSIFTPKIDDGFDYLLAQGYVGFNAIPNILGFQLGHGKNFVGDGHRSLFLSDYSNNYFYFKINTRVWRIHYQNLYCELIQDYNRAQDKVLPKKYMAAHYLSINILKNLNIGIWEATVFSRDKGFELQYLNPIIFYRALEQALGSPDNVMLGLSWKYNFLKRFSFYGQFVLDEFSSQYWFPKDKSKRGWWATKYGLQAGLKYIDVAGVRGLDLQAEFNMARPYIYAYKDSSANYTHYNQPLAHPLGSNFYEGIFILRYQPLPNLHLRAQVNAAVYGRDTMGSNWGSNVHLPYTTWEREFGNVIGQGARTSLLLADLWISYQVRHNLFFDLQYRYRRENSSYDPYDNTSHIFSLGMRWNIAERLDDW